MTGTHKRPRYADSPETQAQQEKEQAATARALERDANLRQQALMRLRYMSIQHAKHAWEQRYRDPIAPYGIAFLYAQPTSRAERWTLRAATKLWLAGPEAADLPRLLFDLTHAVGQRASDPDFDLRRDLANRVDEDMAADASYVGLGVSSLDTYTGTWEQACATVHGYENVPGQIRIVMADSTTIVADRRGLSHFNTLTVHATQALSRSLIDGSFPWSLATVEQLHADAAHTTVLRWMDELNHSLWRADNTRLVARQNLHASQALWRQP